MTEREKAQKRIRQLDSQIKCLKTKLAKELRRNRYQLLCITGDPMPEDLEK